MKLESILNKVNIHLCQQKKNESLKNYDLQVTEIG